jgi:hypothetical protein
VNFAALRSVQSKLSIALVTAASLLLGSCGGGGASSTPDSTGILQVLPSTGTIYAGVPYTINVSGGRKPYLVVSDQFTLLPLNFTLNSNSFQMVANNPGVVDIGQAVGTLPTRSVNLSVRDSSAGIATAKYDVAQNFFTGYGEGYTTTCLSSGTTAAQACSGQDSIVTLVPVSQGTLYGNRALRFDKIRGDFHWVQEPPGQAPQLVDTITLNTDHEGKAILRLRVNVDAPTQLATYRVTDIATGTQTDIVFIITQSNPIDLITLFPESVSFTNGPANQCGSGTATVFVFGGAPPYTITASSPIIVFPQVVQHSGDSFQVSMPANQPTCPPNPAVFVTDSRGQRVQLTIMTGPGGTANVAIAVSPNPIVGLTCAAPNQSAGIVGGLGPLSAISNQPLVQALISGNIITVMRSPVGTLNPAPSNTAAIITITDGTSLYTLNVTGIATTCP